MVAYSLKFLRSLLLWEERWFRLGPRVACVARKLNLRLLGCCVKNFILRLLLATAAALILTLAADAPAQQPDQDSGTASPRQQQRAQPQQQPSPAPSTEAQTQDAHTFTGRIAQENAQFVLKDPITRVTYPLDDQPRARPFIGKQVKVTGKLGLDSNIIHIDSIVPLSQ